jgi:hypothetical protein
MARTLKKQEKTKVTLSADSKSQGKLWISVVRFLRAHERRAFTGVRGKRCEAIKKDAEQYERESE